MVAKAVRNVSGSIWRQLSETSHFFLTGASSSQSYQHFSPSSLTTSGNLLPFALDLEQLHSGPIYADLLKITQPFYSVPRWKKKGPRAIGLRGLFCKANNFPLQISPPCIISSPQLTGNLTHHPSSLADSSDRTTNNKALWLPSLLTFSTWRAEWGLSQRMSFTNCQ